MRIDWKSYTEQISKETNRRNQSCCFCCLTLFVCAILLPMLGNAYLYGGFRTRYPVELTEHDATSMVTGSNGWHNAVKKWVVEEGKDQLFVGTWKTERTFSLVYFFGLDPGWREAQLEIRPDNTFILVDPHESRKDTNRGRRTGKWEASICTSEKTIMVYCTFDSAPSVGDNRKECDAWVLLTLRKNDISNKYLRLLPRKEAEDGYFRYTHPTWKKVIER